MNTEQSVTIPNLKRLVALKQDFDTLIEEIPLTKDNAYFMVLLFLNAKGYTLSEIDQFQEVQELL